MSAPRAGGLAVAAVALLGGVAIAAGSDADTGAPAAWLDRQLEGAQSLLLQRLAVLPADSGVLVLRDVDRLTLRIPARLVFEYDTAVLRQDKPTPAAADAAMPPPLAIPLRASVQLLRKYRALQAQIVVYTDSIGDVTANHGLSDARAQAVYQVLTAAGIAPDRLQWHGAGAASMLAGNQTPQGRIENRRVEIEFRPEPAAAP
jgi:outer membrane protein OmpA-like peptidoglycan-associated protein